MAFQDALEGIGEQIADAPVEAFNDVVPDGSGGSTSPRRGAFNRAREEGLSVLESVVSIEEFEQVILTERRADVKAARERAAVIRQGVRARADIAVQTEAAGAQSGSAAAGATAGLATDVASNLGFLLSQQAASKRMLELTRIIDRKQREREQDSGIGGIGNIVGVAGQAFSIYNTFATPGADTGSTS